MQKNKNIEKIKSFTGKILEPFALGLLALLFIIPALTVVNLSPITKQLQKLNVLGVNTQDGVSVSLVEGKHEIFQSENITKDDTDIYTYSTTLIKRSADNYSKPILEIKNNSQDIKRISFYGQTEIPTKSNIRIIANDKSYPIQDDIGQTYPQEISINPNEKATIFLSIESLTGVQFSEDFEMQIKVVK